MKKSRYTESQIVKILKEVEGGRLVKEVCREYSISDATYYNWKAKYGGMEASDIKRLKDLEDENRMGQSLRRALAGRKKLLLTATPLQNTLMELYGLATLIDEQLFGDERSFRQSYIQGQGSVPELKGRLKGFIHRTLRRDVLEYVRYTQRQTLTVPFTPTTQEEDLYKGISALLERDESYAQSKISCC